MCALRKQKKNPNSTATTTAPTVQPSMGNPRVQHISRMNNTANVGAHAAMLNRAPANQQSSNKQLLLQLQQQYGNGYVNQVLQLARKGGAKTPASPKQQLQAPTAKPSSSAGTSKQENIKQPIGEKKETNKLDHKPKTNKDQQSNTRPSEQSNKHNNNRDKQSNTRPGEQSKAAKDKNRQQKPTQADKRTMQQKQADLRKAVAEVEQTMTKPEATPETVKAKIPNIKSKYRLKSAKLLKDKNKGYYVKVEINPVLDTLKTWFTRKQPARLLSANMVNVEELPLGHKMTFAIQIDAGKNPKGEKYPSKDNQQLRYLPHSLHGVTFEWWEKIEMEYDFEDKSNQPDEIQRKKQQREGYKLKKPWSDLYPFKPDAKTYNFDNTGWLKAVKDAQNGTFTGVKTVNIIDQPAFSNLESNKYKKRILNFRAVAKDLDQHKNGISVLATQILIQDGNEIHKSYKDNKGHDLVSGSIPSNQEREPQFNVEDELPNGVMESVNLFKKQIQQGKAQPFENTEYKNANINLSNKKNFLDEVNKHRRYMIHQTYDIVPIPKSGQEYKQYRMKGNDLLVALIDSKTKKIFKIYHTTVAQQKTQQERQNSNINNSENYSHHRRKFTEIPI